MRHVLAPFVAFLPIVASSCSEIVSSPPSERARYRSTWYHKAEALCASASNVEVASSYYLTGTSEFIVRRRAGDPREFAEVEHVALKVNRLEFTMGRNCERSGHDQPVLVSPPELIGDMRTGGRLVNRNGRQTLEVHYQCRIRPAVVRYTLDDGTVVQRSVGDGTVDGIMEMPAAVRLERRDHQYRRSLGGIDPEWAYWTSSDLVMIEEPQ